MSASGARVGDTWIFEVKIPEDMPSGEFFIDAVVTNRLNRPILRANSIGIVVQ
ncbi:MAG: hypothetical protein ACXVCP_12790 [Bdellovibrio sp.]